MEKEKNLFQSQPWISVFALTAAVLWGWAYPLIKLGFQEFQIDTEMTAGKMLYAGIRFFLSGAIILAFAAKRKLNFRLVDRGGWWYVLVFALLNTTLHYAFFYFGLSHSAGARSAILNSLGVFVVVVAACFLFKSDRFTLNKALGCVLGIAGVLALNLGNAESGRFTWLGDGMIILNALCSAAASLMTKGLGKRVDIFVGTGYSLSLGGALLIIPGLLSGGTLPKITMLGCAILLGLVIISTTGFTLYNKLISCNPVGKVAIYNSLIPVVGAVTSCLCLNETFYWKYVLSGTLAAVGIFMINKGKD